MQPPNFLDGEKFPPWKRFEASTPPLGAWAQLRFPPRAPARGGVSTGRTERASDIDGSTAQEKSFPWGVGRGADVRRLAISPL